MNSTYEYTSFLPYLLSANIIMLCFLVISTLLIYFFFYRNKRKIFTLKKISIMSIFFSIFIIQSFVGANTINVWISFDVVTIIIVSFLFGPIEGLIYAIAADWTRVLIMGYNPQFYYAIQYPFTAILSGFIGMYIGKNKNESNKKIQFITVQGLIILVMSGSLSMMLFNFSGGEWRNVPEFWEIILSSSLLFACLEFFYIWFFVKHKDKQTNIVTALFIICFLNRIINGIVIKTIGDTYWYLSSYQAFINLLTIQIFKSSYLIPAQILISWTLISASIFAANQVSNKKNFGIQI